MTTDFSKVSLGFAEFVSQLIHETFDAILDSQNYQLDKYIELESALNTPNSLFMDKYISKEEYIDFQIAFLGFTPIKNIQLTQTNIDLISSVIEKDMIEKLIQKNQLTEFGLKYLMEMCLIKLVETKKSKLRTLLNHPELARLIVDSGEIKAKLEIFCLNETIETKQTSKGNLTKTVLAKNNPTISKTNFDIKEIKLDKQFDIKVKEIIDNQTQLKTLLIDRNSISKSNNSINTIPTTRMVANPIPSSTTTNIYSEVTIKFKSI